MTLETFSMNGRGVRLGLGLVTLALMLAALYMVFVYVPTEADQGIVQRIFYFHVPCAWVAFASFALVAIAGIFYLWLGQQVWDDLGYAAAETGMVFCTLVLVTGLDLGQAYLGRVVDLGFAPDDHANPVAAVWRVPDAARDGG